MVDVLKDVEICKKDLKMEPAKHVLKNKIVGLYFAAYYCPASHSFHPKLKKFYEELASDDFEIVYVSADKNKDDFVVCLDERQGDWYHIPFGSPAIQGTADKLGVRTIPTLVIFGRNGKLITKEGREDVDNKTPVNALADWMKADR